MLTTNIGSELSLTDVKTIQPSGAMLGIPITTLTRERIILMMLEMYKHQRSLTQVTRGKE